MSRNKTILLSLLLSLPVIMFLLHHYFNHSAELNPTGFTVDENVLYMSYAHQYLDAETTSLFYSNPFDGNPNSPAIYFQPVNFLFAAALKAGIDPGFCFSLFGLLMAIACIYMGFGIIKLLVDNAKDQTLLTVLFTWGGGLTAFAGLMSSAFLPGHQYPEWLDGIFAADPANGWWGLNWGRNLFIPLEAYYHFLFLLNIYCLLKKKWVATAVLSLFLSFSHPFTGIEYLSIVLGWLAIEKLVCRNKEIPYWFAFVIAGITGIHCWYYLVYLNQYPEHRQLFTQYSAGWTYSLFVALPAYCIVAGLAFFTRLKYKNILLIPHQRLFLGWAIIAFLLSKHEWFIKPMQPIHFTRGYTWAGLFLFAIPGLLWLINYLKEKRKWLLIVLLVIFLSDNILWTTNLLLKKDRTEWEGHITNDTREVLEYLKKNSSANDLAIGNASLVCYLLNVYSPANAWVSHPYNTPEREKRMEQVNLFLKNRMRPEAWRGRRILVIFKKNQPETTPGIPNATHLFENESYIILTP